MFSCLSIESFVPAALRTEPNGLRPVDTQDLHIPLADAALVQAVILDIAFGEYRDLSLTITTFKPTLQSYPKQLGNRLRSRRAVDDSRLAVQLQTNILVFVAQSISC